MKIESYCIEPVLIVGDTISQPVVGTTLPLFTVLTYEVHNTRSSDIEAVELNIPIANKFVGPDKDPDGLAVNPIGANVTYIQHNWGTECIFKPQCGGSLGSEQGFSVQFISAKSTWMPIIQSGQYPRLSYKGNYDIHATEKLKSTSRNIPLWLFIVILSNCLTTICYWGLIIRNKHIIKTGKLKDNVGKVRADMESEKMRSDLSTENIAETLKEKLDNITAQVASLKNNDDRIESDQSPTRKSPNNDILRN